MAFERLRWISAALALLGTACGGGVQRFPLAEPMWYDPDRRPFAEEPEEYFSGLIWDGADQLVFRPVARFFAVDPAGEAINVNALDEVPDSSWFTNRIGRRRMSLPELTGGPCRTPPPNENAIWTITQAKPNGANPGFIIKADDGKTYLLKFDGVDQGPRATSADVVGSLLYYAAGYFSPCNRIVSFDPRNLRLDPEAETDDGKGNDIPMTRDHVDQVLSKGLKLPGGRYRASASLFLDGKPLGPWTYQGTRGDDPNDVVAHEDRRELRGMRLLAAWIQHFDSREMNTLATFIGDGKSGYIRHNMVDFGDSFGSIWEPPMMGRRLGHSYYFDVPQVLADLFTFGIPERPWDHLRFGPSGRIFGYFDVASFNPERWVPGYPNPAFVRMSERDGAWMARIISRFTDADVAALVSQAKIEDRFIERELIRILKGRRDKILWRYLGRLSPLADPVLQVAPGGVRLCLTDLAVRTDLASSSERVYTARAFTGDDPVALAAEKVEPDGVCVRLPALPGATPSSPNYSIVDISASNPMNTAPVRLHFYQLGGSDYRLVGLERPYDDSAPDL